MKSKEKILLFTGRSQYGIFTTTIQDLSEAFEKLGYNAKVIQNQASIGSLLQDISESKFVFGLNNIDLPQKHQGIYDEVKVPKVALMVDHPIYHVKRLSRNIKNLICMFGDYEWSKYAKRYITNNNCYFVPFAAKKFNHTVEFTNRPIDILFAGGIQDPDKIRQSWSQSDTEVAAKMDNMVEEGLWDTNKTLRELWINQFGEELLMNPEMHKGGVDIILQEVDRYIRHYRRRKVVDTLLQSGAKLHICGDQWGWLDNKYDKQVELLGKVSFSSFIELMQQSKSVLNVNPGMTHGMHERILTAMMNGAISITDSNSYIDKEFVDLEDVVMYSYTDLDSAYEKIKGILTNDEYRYHITQNAMEKCKQRHTWKHRAQKIIRIVENHEKRLRI